MESKIFLDSYGGQSVKELISLEQTHRIDSIVLAFEAALTTRKDNNENLSTTELIILAIEGFEREINNGGFDQFFSNSTVEYVPIIVSSLSTIGCGKLASLAQRAIDSLGIDSLDPDSIEDKIYSEDEKLEDILAELDNQFYTYDEVPAYALFDYIKSNHQSIRLV